MQMSVREIGWVGPCRRNCYSGLMFPRSCKYGDDSHPNLQREQVKFAWFTLRLAQELVEMHALTHSLYRYTCTHPFVLAARARSRGDCAPSANTDLLKTPQPVTRCIDAVELLFMRLDCFARTCSRRKLVALDNAVLANVSAVPRSSTRSTCLKKTASWTDNGVARSFSSESDCR